MKDFFGTPLIVGDKVAFVTKHYRDLTHGTIIAVTPKQVRVLYQHYGGAETTLRYPNVLVKSPEA